MNYSDSNYTDTQLSKVRHDSSRRIFIPLLLVLSFSFISYIYILSIATEKIDQQAQSEMYNRVEVALEIENTRLKDLLNEYAYWDTAYDNLIKSPNHEWANENIGAHMADNLSIIFSLAIRGDNTESIVYLDGALHQGLLPQLLEVGIDQLFPEVRKETSKPTPVTTYLNFEGQLVMVALDTFTPEFDHSPPSDGSLLLIAKPISSEYIKNIGKVYRIPGLRLRDEGTSTDTPTYSISDQMGSSTLTLEWDKVTPATNITEHTLPPLGVIFIAMIVLGAWMIRIDIKRRQQQTRMLANLATHDSLTGLYNRRQFFHLANKELHRTDREKSSVSLLIIDIDYFKQVNDKYGHVAGDKVIINTGQVLIGALREFDVIARYGGEEFVVLLPNTNLEQANEIAERLRQCVESSSVQDNGGDIAVTISIGITSYRYEEETRELLARADTALYGAKNSGRNQCHTAAN